MEKEPKKEDSINLIVHINELICQTEVTQYFKNTKTVPIELEIVIPHLDNCNITKFEMIKNNQKIISKLLEKEKAKEKYVDTITQGNSSFLSYEEENEIKIYLGNIPPGEEVELKTFFFSPIISKDFSYQATFPIKFPNFVMTQQESKEKPYCHNKPEYYEYENMKVQGKIYINTYSKMTRLIVYGLSVFDSEKIFGDNKNIAEIDFIEDYFTVTSISGIVLFRTEKINDDLLYYQCDLKRNKSYYMLQKTMFKPKFSKEFKDDIDEDENIKYSFLLKNDEEKEKANYCYIFLLDQSGSMSGGSIELSCKSLLLFLQSLNQNCYFQLIGFGTDFEFYSEKPLEYNKENIKNLMDIIKNLKADKGGTNLFNPLDKIYSNKIYSENYMKKYIILLTDGEVHNKEKVINLIGANSSKFIFNSIGIGYCDKDLIEKTALIGNGFSYYINNLDELNPVVISLLEKTQNIFKVNCLTNQKCSIEEKCEKFIHKNDYFTHGFILDDINIRDIEFNINLNDKKEIIKITFDKNKIIKLPDGDILGKLIVGNYLNNSKDIDSKTKINLSKEYNILTNETAFYAKMINEVKVTDKMVKITNKDKTATNNKIEENNKKQIIIEDNNDYIYNDELFAYDKEEEQPEEENKNFISKLFSKIFSSSDDKSIIKKDNYIYKLKKEKKDKKKEKNSSKKKESKKSYIDYDYAMPNISEGYYLSYDDKEIDNDYIDYSSKQVKKEEKKVKKIEKVDKKTNKIEIKKEFVFDEFILNQDIIEGNWTKDSQCEMLIKEEKDYYEKINKYCEVKGIKDEKGIITLFVLYYIYHKKTDKLPELKFVINKAKNYVKTIFNQEYENIIKEIDTK